MREEVDWDEMYVYLIECTGWTWEYIDEFMTLPRLGRMNDYWTRIPPLHILVASYFGFDGRKPEEKREGLGSLLGLAKTMKGGKVVRGKVDG